MNVLTEKQKEVLLHTFIHHGVEEDHAIDTVNCEDIKWICDYTYMVTGKTLLEIIEPETFKRLHNSVKELLCKQNSTQKP